MESSREESSQNLVKRAAAGDQGAAELLFQLYRNKLKSMISLRLDQRLSARVDPSDVLQETMIQAHQKLPEYLQTQPIPFYPWLRRIAWENIIQLHRQHLAAQGRTVTREERIEAALPDQSAMDLAERLFAKTASASRQLIQKELKARVQAALGQLDARDREVLVLRFLEQLSIDETAAVLELSSEAVKSRQRRALERFSLLMGDAYSEELP